MKTRSNKKATARTKRYKTILIAPRKKLQIYLMYMIKEKNPPLTSHQIYIKNLTAITNLRSAISPYEKTINRTEKLARVDNPKSSNPPRS